MIHHYEYRLGNTVATMVVSTAGMLLAILAFAWVTYSL